MADDTQSVMDRIVDILSKAKVDEYEIYHKHSSNLSIEVKEHEIDSFEASQSAGVGVRVIKNNRMGFSYTSDLGSAALNDMVELATAGGSATAADKNLSIPEAPKAPLPTPDILDGGLSNIPESEKIERAMKLEQAVYDADKRVTRVRQASYGEARLSVSLENSHGLSESFDSTHIFASVMAVAVENDDAQMAWDYDFSHKYDELDIESIGQRAGKRAAALLGAKTVKSRSCPVLVENFAAAELLGVLAGSFSAESVAKEKSMLRGKDGKTIASDIVNIVDDGLYPKGISSSPFDGEGVRRGSTSLVKDGILQGFLYDSYWGKRLGAASTGNSGRPSFNSVPTLGISNFFLEPGKTSHNECLKQMGDGFYLTEFMGIHTANPITGDFSVGTAGFLVENGEIGQPITGMAVSGNLLEMFMDIDVVASDLRFLGKVGAPSLLIGSMSISGS